MSEGVPTELDGWASTKPIRVAFLVEQSAHSALALDGIFADCYSRWGGRFSLVVPCLDGRICDQYWPWLEVFDPDVVYSYVELQATEVLGIHERIAPADYIYGRLIEPVRLDVHGFKPGYRFQALSSLSTVFRLGRHSPPSNGPRVKVVDSWHTESTSRFLSDNLGTYFQSTGTGMYPNDARTAAGRLTVVSDAHWDNPRSGVPRDLDRVSSEQDAFAAFVEHRATSMSLLSTLYAQHVELRDDRWSTAFNLVVGDTFEDRLLFWNARLLIPTWLDSNLCCLRITLDQLEDDSFVPLLVKLLNSRNHVTAGSGQARLAVRSASQSIEVLDVVLKRLQEARIWSASGPVEVIPGGHVIPSAEALMHAREEVELGESRLRIARRSEFRWRPPVVQAPTIEPEHLDDAPPGQYFTLGLWRQDFVFEALLNFKWVAGRAG